MFYTRIMRINFIIVIWNVSFTIFISWEPYDVLPYLYLIIYSSATLSYAFNVRKHTNLYHLDFRIHICFTMGEACFNSTKKVSWIIKQERNYTHMLHSLCQKNLNIKNDSCILLHQCSSALLESLDFRY